MPISSTVTCPWCRSNYSGQIPTNCSNCGGPLPAADSSQRGAAPPPPPRQLPEKFKKQVLLWKNAPAFIGFIFMIIGIPLLAAFGFGLIFLIIGYFVYKAGKKSGLKKLRALEQGIGCEGSILEIGRDTTVEVNGRNPYVIRYQFSVNGSQHVGATNTWDDATMLRKVGDPLWIVYAAGAEEASSIWPPLV